MSDFKNKEISLMSPQKIKITSQDRSRERMKITIKFSKEEAEGFKNFVSITKPENVTENDYIKGIFMQGVKVINDKLSQISKQYVLNNKDELGLSGINVVENSDGSISLEESQ